MNPPSSSSERGVRGALGLAFVLALIGQGASSCGGDDPVGFQEAGATSTSSATGGGGGAGGAEPTGCADCAPGQICIDDLYCADGCPDGRDLCHPAGAPDDGACCPAEQQCCEASVFGYASADLCRPKDEACPIGCPGGEAACDIGQLCEIDPQVESYVCKDECAPGKLCDYNLCCPLGASCVESECPLPDLSINEQRVSDSAVVEVKYFANDACEIVEGCIGGPGYRTLLRFDLQTPNEGPGDLELGDPSANPGFHYSDCHAHYHFDGYADYRLLNDQGIEIGQGHKQAFCLLDYELYSADANPDPRYDCGFQGIQKGWSDVYGRYLPCQWVDVTEVPPGSYTLKVSLNKDRIIAEASYDNNEALVPVVVPGNSCVNGCRSDDPVCCAAGNPCGWDNDGSCDCADAFGWDGADCSSCLNNDPACDLGNTCPAGCTADQGACCGANDSCGLANNHACDCGGVYGWDAVDCSNCLSPNPICPVNTCPAGCTAPNPNDPCCTDGAACGWANDGWCDCGGAAWDAADCALCLSLEPDCP